MTRRVTFIIAKEGKVHFKEISSRGEFPDPEKLPAVVREIKT